MSKRKERQSNIELLRIFSMIGVVLLHYNNASIGMGLHYVEPNTINYYVMYFGESLFICAVNVFVLITGYFMISSMRRDVIKPFKFIIQVVNYSLIVFLFNIIRGKTYFNIKDLIRCLIPCNYFVILYSALFFISLYFNVVFNKLNKKQTKIMIITLFVIFSIWNFICDFSGEVTNNEWFGLSTVGMYGSQYGYSIVNFSLMYMIGAYVRKYGKHYSKFKSIGIILLCSIVIMFIALLGFTGSAWEYCNPFVIIEAWAIFNLFKEINLPTNKIINTLSSGAFSVFLLHFYLFPKIQIEKFVNQNVFVFILHALISSIFIYIICSLIHIVYTWIMEHIFSLILKNRKSLKIEIVS